MVGAVDPLAAAKEYLKASADDLDQLAGGDAPQLVARGAVLVAEALAGGGKVLFCGNGGSAADAQHLAAELVGRLDRGRERDALPGMALTTDTSVLTALANDYGYGEVFARQVRALGRPGDVLVCLSTSGASDNVIRAAEAARQTGVAAVAVVGPDASPLDGIAEVTIHAPGTTSGRIQQAHITLGHLLCQLAEDVMAER